MSAAKKAKTGITITELAVVDIRFPTSLGNHGSDAMVPPFLSLSLSLSPPRPPPATW